MHNKRRNSWELEDTQDPNTFGGRGSIESTIYHTGVGGVLLKDTAVYCTAEKFGLDELKRLALRKQGLQSGIQINVILRSARFAYDNTPDTDSRLRAHYLALIIRIPKTFKMIGTMQTEMEIGGSKLYDEVLATDYDNRANGFRARFFDLFVAMCNHVDDIVDMFVSLSLQPFEMYTNGHAAPTTDLQSPSSLDTAIIAIQDPRGAQEANLKRTENVAREPFLSLFQNVAPIERTPYPFRKPASLCPMQNSTSPLNS